MANTVIQLRKSSTPSSVPADLANGELAINFADGKLFYKNTAGYIAEISGGGNSFGTVNADGTLIVSDTSGDVLTLLPGNNITITGDAVNDRVTISANMPSNTAAIGYTIVGGGNVITTGLIGTGVYVPFDASIQSVTLLADQTGSIVIDVWKTSYSNFPPISSNSICASAKPTITASNKSQDTTLTGWTKTINSGDVLYFNVDSCASITNVVLTLKVNKT